MSDKINSTKKVAKNPTGILKTIYDILPAEDRLSDADLESVLQKSLRGLSLIGMPPRTRSKFVKGTICTALGYEIPSSFTKIRPRFPCHDFDVYIQKSNNLQIWNEIITPARRYVIIQVIDDQIARVRVINGETLAKLDTTGTLTIKYQATVGSIINDTELISTQDTDRLCPVVRSSANLQGVSPIDPPRTETLLSIQAIFELLKPLVWNGFPDSGFDQDRNRGAGLHKLICKQLGYNDFHDNGSFPDIPNQLLEVKLQTSPTIDLGGAKPDSEKILQNIKLDGIQVRHCDIRYAVFYAKVSRGEVLLTNCFIVTGKDFFSRFSQFQGMVVNKKLQLPLPKNFFTD